MTERDFGYPAEELDTVEHRGGRISRILGAIRRQFTSDPAATAYWPVGEGPGRLGSPTMSQYAGDGHGEMIGVLGEMEIEEMKQKGTYIAPGYSPRRP